MDFLQKADVDIFDINMAIVMSASYDATIKIGGISSPIERMFGHSSGTLATVFEGHSDKVLDAKFTIDKRYVISASADCTVCRWISRNGILRMCTRDIQIACHVSLHRLMVQKSHLEV